MEFFSLVQEEVHHAARALRAHPSRSTTPDGDNEHKRGRYGGEVQFIFPRL